MAKKDAVNQAEMSAPETSKFNFVLVVVNPFGKYKKGELIAEDEAIQTIIDKKQQKHCNRLSR